MKMRSNWAGDCGGEDEAVETRQIACTILKALAMDCNGLASERVEPSKALPHSNPQEQRTIGNRASIPARRYTGAVQDRLR
jgi:hypothetical protein